MAATAMTLYKGFGDYEETGPEVHTNSLVKPLTTNSIPFMHTSNEAIRVTRREFIGIVPVLPSRTDVAAQIRRVLNPGDAQTFPWLHNLARNYTQWLPAGMVFEYRATCGTGIATTPNIGVVRMTTQYDVYQPIFGSDVVRMMNHFFTQTTSPFASTSHAIECAPEQTSIKPLFIRPEAVLQHRDVETKSGDITLIEHSDATFDARLYDLGRFEMNNSGGVASYEAGELWITYDIVLMKPRQQLTNGFTYDSDFVVADQSNTVTLRNEYTMALTDVEVIPDEPVDP